MKKNIEALRERMQVTSAASMHSRKLLLHRLISVGMQPNRNGDWSTDRLDHMTIPPQTRMGIFAAENSRRRAYRVAMQAYDTLRKAQG